MVGLLLVCLLLVLLFGGLGLTVSPLFFVMVVVLILAFGWGGFSRRGQCRMTEGQRGGST